jgi:ABC-2 type transport system ATP-binding protein
LGSGWGQAGDDSLTTPDLFGGMTIGSLRAAGYNVLTWDPRGFGQSGGTIEVDSPQFEARDVSAMLDWIATQHGVQLDHPRDPRTGMVGASYGGGIQLVAAAIDCRIDAIVPTIAWNSLVTSLDKGGITKTGWGGILNAAAAGRSADPHVALAYQSGITNGSIDQAVQSWYAGRGPAALLTRIHAPTLLVQGTVDTLFTLDEGIANYNALRKQKIPLGMVWFCGGHGACLTDQGDTTQVAQATQAWLSRYVKGDQSIKTGPGFRFVDQNGSNYSAPGYPLSQGPTISASGNGTLQLTATGGAGPAAFPPGVGGPLGSLVQPITPAKAGNAVDVDVALGSRSAVVVGAPQLVLAYRGTVPSGPKPTAVFGQLVDNKTGLVVGNQITPVPLILDGSAHQTTVPLESIAYTVRPGAHLTLQLVATTVAYTQPRLGGTVTFDQIRLSLPTVTGVRAK